jgi:hypothetical protein
MRRQRKMEMSAWKWAIKLILLWTRVLMEMCRGEVGRETYGFEVRLLEANIEEPEVLVKLDLGRHAEKRNWLVDERTRMQEVERE